MMKNCLIAVFVLCLVIAAGCSNGKTASEWGVSMLAEEVSATGCTLSIQKRGGNADGGVYYGASYWLEQQTTEGWKQMEPLIEVGWEMWAREATYQTAQMTCGWKSLYGVLPEGTYRVGKSFLNSRGPGNYDELDHYTDPFTIQ